MSDKDEGMTKYGVEVEKPKPGSKTAGKGDPKVNVPHDPEKGTEPFEKKRADK